MTSTIRPLLRLACAAPLIAIACTTVEEAPTTLGDAGTTSSGTGTTSSGTGTQGGGGAGSAAALDYAIVDTAQADCFGATTGAACPAAGAAFFGQDAQWSGHAPSYEPSADGLTVLDRTTRLTWQRTPDLDGDGALGKADKLTATAAVERCAALAAAKWAGADDWRLPSIKELYSLIDFRGTDPSGLSGSDTSGLRPFIDTGVFAFDYGHVDEGERIIDSQYASSTRYVVKAGAEELLFGVNFADGRIKGYGVKMPDGGDKTFFVQCVRGNPGYGVNRFVDHADATIGDEATGLTWAKADSGEALDWEHALAWVAARNAESFLGHADWRLPNVKELQSLVDYARSPDGTGGPAIDPIFSITPRTNEDGVADWPWFWASTTHASFDGHGSGTYVAFGRAGGWMKRGDATCYSLVDVHGAGAQRSDPKVAKGLHVIGTKCDGTTAYGLGPQGDVLRGENFVRLVRGGATFDATTGGGAGAGGAGAGGGPGGGGDGPGGGGGPGGPGGPQACATQADCDAAVCPGAMGCTCASTPSGSFCIPRCSTDADCPKPPDTSLVCGPEGLCVPKK